MIRSALWSIFVFDRFTIAIFFDVVGKTFAKIFFKKKSTNFINRNLVVFVTKNQEQQINQRFCIFSSNQYTMARVNHAPSQAQNQACSPYMSSLASFQCHIYYQLVSDRLVVLARPIFACKRGYKFLIFRCIILAMLF